jgi:ParB family chromosome partitioning protein
MIQDILLNHLEDNPYNSRINYSPQQIKTLAQSIDRHGLLSPIKVRKIGDRFQIVYGHRRVRAVQFLKFLVISADVCELSDEDMLELSYAENVAREDLSDYEKALYFDRMNKEFHKTYEEIGAAYHVSRAQICNYVRMTRLFDERTLAINPWISGYLVQITERHARALSRVDDPTKRMTLMKSVVEDDLSVRDLERMIVGFRGWLNSRTEDRFLGQDKYDLYSRDHEELEYPGGINLSEILELRNAVESQFRLPSLGGDYQSFMEMITRDLEYSLFSIYAGGELKVGTDALKVEEDWFYSTGRSVRMTIRNFRTKFFGKIALATCHLDVEESSDPKLTLGTYGGTIIYVRRQRKWKILHEHWSKIAEQSRDGSCSPGYTSNADLR